MIKILILFQIFFCVAFVSSCGGSSHSVLTTDATASNSIRLSLNTQDLILSSDADPSPQLNDISVDQNAPKIIYAKFKFTSPPGMKHFQISALQPTYQCGSVAPPEGIKFFLFPEGHTEARMLVEPSKFVVLEGGRSMILQVKISNSNQCPNMDVKFSSIFRND